jgi:transmembrane sensor
MNKTEKYTDKDWEKIASILSGETEGSPDDLKNFRKEDHSGTEKKWIETGEMGKDKSIDVDRAWTNLYSRIGENGLLLKADLAGKRFEIRSFMRIAATVLIFIGLAGTMFYLFSNNIFSGKTVLATGGNERNMEVSLPDGSKVYLNRNSELSFHKNPGGSSRKVTLKGEAFFDIQRDPSRPFIIDAGKASIKVLGTSFSVLTSNSNNAVEVFVKTGTVLLSDNTGAQSLVLEPGYIGTMDQKYSTKVINDDPNYLSWNTDLLYFEGKKLSVVFTDLKKVFDIDIVADNPEILNERITTTFEKESQDTIIRIICSTFNLTYRKEGSVYHLSGR